MKNIIVRSALIGCVALFATSSCEDFLDQEVQAQYAEQDFYQTDADAEQAVTAIYDMMQRHLPNGAWVSTLMVKTLPSDESNAGGGSSTDQPQYQELDDFEYDERNSGVVGAWRNYYSTIYRANKVINNIEVEANASALRKRLVAEAKTLRAFAYLELVSLWGAVPLVLQDIAPSEFGSFSRNPVEEVYAQIETDLNEAIPDLPLRNQYDALDRFRVSKGTAQALLGKAHLYQDEYTLAITQFEAVIGATTAHGLEPSIGRLFSQAGEYGIESLLETSFTARQNYGWGNFPWNDATESNIHIQLSGPREDYYTRAPGDSLLGGWGFNQPTQKMWDAVVRVDAIPNSSRKWATIMSEAELEALGGNWNPNNLSIHDFEGFFRRRYGTFEQQGGGTEVPVLNYSTNVRLLRFADVLLMAAEAYNKSGNDAKAREYINRVRRRSGLPDIAETVAGNALFEAIVDERFVELAFEGHRFPDLLRWGKAEQELSSRGFRTRHQYFPIPEEDVQIGKLEQNPGYGE